MIKELKNCHKLCSTLDEAGGLYLKPSTREIEITHFIQRYTSQWILDELRELGFDQGNAYLWLYMFSPVKWALILENIYTCSQRPHPYYIFKRGKFVPLNDKERHEILKFYDENKKPDEFPLRYPIREYDFINAKSELRVQFPDINIGEIL
jgi:hypothetical protein